MTESTYHVPAATTSSALMMGILTSNDGGFHFDAADDDETEKIILQVKQCLAKDCSVEAVNDLVDVLKQHQQDIQRRIDEVQAMGKTLEKIVDDGDDGDVTSTSSSRRNIASNRSSRETVRAVSRLLEEGGYKKQALGSIGSSKPIRFDEMTQNHNFSDEFLFQKTTSKKHFSP